MSIKKYSEFISLHEQKTKTIGLRSSNMDEIYESSYTYHDDKAPTNAELTSGRGGDIDYKSVSAHLKSTGVPDQHVKAIIAHLKKDPDVQSTKLKHGVMSKHGNLVVHSSSDADSGKTKFSVESAKD